MTIVDLALRIIRLNCFQDFRVICGYTKRRFQTSHFDMSLTLANGADADAVRYRRFPG